MMLIREAKKSDAPFLSKICLLTADAGKSAEQLHDFEELPGLIFAVPYVQLPKTWGFVLEDESTSEVVGYVLGSTDTRYFEQYAREHWWPPLAEKYAKEDITKSADAKYVNILQNMFTASAGCINFSPAHLHINILEQYQRKGWGRRLIDKGLEYLKEQGLDAVWLGIDPRNDAARVFYSRLGFEKFEGAAENEFGLRF
jgi:ribosomal protein S18 acetylase RimI-like enzyme